MLDPTVSRVHSGIHIEGHELSIALYPTGNGRLAVAVTAAPSITGYDDDCRIGNSENGYDFLLSEIVVSDTRLDCFVSNRNAPFFHEGFWLTLEPGMAILLRQWLPRLWRVVGTAEALNLFLAKKLGRDVSYLGLGANVVARVMLDEMAPAAALEVEQFVFPKGASSDRELVALLDDDEVLLILNAPGAKEHV
jgi:hypothetical protein